MLYNLVNFVTRTFTSFASSQANLCNLMILINFGLQHRHAPEKSKLFYCFYRPPKQKWIMSRDVRQELTCQVCQVVNSKFKKHHLVSKLANQYSTPKKCRKISKIFDWSQIWSYWKRLKCAFYILQWSWASHATKIPLPVLKFASYTQVSKIRFMQKHQCWCKSENYIWPPDCPSGK